MRLLLGLTFALVVSLALGDDCQGLCDATETCCDGPTPGEVGCCPEPNAVCCSDGLHCCPEDTVCNLSAGTCDSGAHPIIPYIFRKKILPPPVKKVRPAIGMEVANKVEIVYCPGGTYYCADGSTCCLLASGQYGCCPYPSAVCCADRVHCCPGGTHCDSTSTMCLQGNNRYAALFKRPAFKI